MKSENIVRNRFQNTTSNSFVLRKRCKHIEKKKKKQKETWLSPPGNFFQLNLGLPLCAVSHIQLCHPKNRAKHQQRCCRSCSNWVMTDTLRCGHSIDLEREEGTGEREERWRRPTAGFMIFFSCHKDQQHVEIT